MTTQAQGKGKRKNKEGVMKVSLDEFNQIDAPHGHSVVSLKMTGLDWAETMADYDQQAAETQQIIVPAAPRAQRGPAVDFDSLPNEPPFRVSLFNVPMSVDEKELSDRFFQSIDVKRVEISKSSSTVELGSKNDLYEALCKDGSTYKGRTVNVCLYGQTPQNSYNSDRFGGRGGNSSYGDRYNNDRNQGGFGGQRANDRYGDRSGGYNRDREGYGSFGRSGFGQQRGGFGDRYNDRNSFRDNNRGSYTSGGGEPVTEEPSNWRARPNVPKSSPPSSYSGRQPYYRPEPAHHHHPPPSHHQQHDSYYQPRYQHHHNPTNNSPYNDHNNQSSSDNQPSPSSNEERPKLVLQKRKTPLNVNDVSSVARNEAIFGKAKPSSLPYEKMKEVEEKLNAVQLADKKEPEGPPQPPQAGLGPAPVPAPAPAPVPAPGSGLAPESAPVQAPVPVPGHHQRPSTLAPKLKRGPDAQPDNSTRFTRN